MGLNAHRVLDRREYGRLATSPLLHANLPHLVSNCSSLVVDGLPLERRLGSVQFAALLASCTAMSQGLYGASWGLALRTGSMAQPAGKP